VSTGGKRKRARLSPGPFSHAAKQPYWQTTTPSTPIPVVSAPVPILQPVMLVTRGLVMLPAQPVVSAEDVIVRTLPVEVLKFNAVVSVD
jgi:hypothetical protein